MPILQVFGLPKNQTEKELYGLYNEIVFAAHEVKELGLTKTDFTVFFPADRMEYGLGEEVICFVRGLFTKPERTDEVRNCLAEAVGKVLRKHFPTALLVECIVESFNPAEGFWSSLRRD